MSVSTIVTKALAFLKGGEEAKMERFFSKTDKYIQKQISMRKDKIETLRDKIADANETLEEAILNVNLEKVNKVETIESYVPQYLRTITDAKASVEALETEIETLETEIKEFEALKTLIFQA